MVEQILEHMIHQTIPVLARMVTSIMAHLYAKYVHYSSQIVTFAARKQSALHVYQHNSYTIQQHKNVNVPQIRIISLQITYVHLIQVV